MHPHMVDETTVGFDFPLTRTKYGQVHKSSLRALVREARRIAPEFANAACVELSFGTDENDYRMVTFDPNFPRHSGLGL